MTATPIPAPGEFCYRVNCFRQATVYTLVTVNGITELHPRCPDHELGGYEWGEPIAKQGDPLP